MTQSQSAASDMESFNISDADLESLLSLDWECPKVASKDTDSLQASIDDILAKEIPCEDSMSMQELVDPKIVGNSRICNGGKSCSCISP